MKGWAYTGDKDTVTYMHIYLHTDAQRDWGIWGNADTDYSKHVYTHAQRDWLTSEDAHKPKYKYICMHTDAQIGLGHNRRNRHAYKYAHTCRKGMRHTTDYRYGKKIMCPYAHMHKVLGDIMGLKTCWHTNTHAKWAFDILAMVSLKWLVLQKE